MVNFRPITKDNFQAVIDMKRPEGETYVMPTVLSLAQAWLRRDEGRVHPFTIYDDDRLVGFMLLDEVPDRRHLIIWRILFPNENMNKGYGSAAIAKVLSLARESGKFDTVSLNCNPNNSIAKHVYEKMGFRPTGEVEGDEIIMGQRL